MLKEPEAAEPNGAPAGDESTWDEAIRQHQALIKEREQTQAMLEPSTFSDFVQMAHGHLFGRLRVEQDPRQYASVGPVSAQGLLRPTILRPWSEFNDIRQDQYSKLEKLFGDKRLFPSKSEVAYTACRVISQFPIKDGYGHSGFAHTALEEPLQKVMTEFLPLNYPEVKNKFELSFRDTPAGFNQADVTKALVFEDDREPPNERRYYEMETRWGILSASTGLYETFNFLIGKHKAPHELGYGKLQSVLDAQPSERFMQEMLEKRIAARTEEPQEDDDDAWWPAIDNMSPSWPEVMSTEELFAITLCQTFHCMIKTGIPCAYLLSGDTLVLLHVPFSSPETLLYHPVQLSLLEPESPEGYRNTALAYLTSLSMLKLDLGRGGAQWISEATARLPVWDERPSQSPRLDIGLSRPPIENPKVSYPAKPYCTSACLLGLCRRSVVDPDCPNTTAHLRGKKSGRGPRLHKLTLDQVICGIKQQLELNFDNGCVALDERGHFGESSTLLKLSLEDYHYTFVGKGVPACLAHRIDAEARKYSALEVCQATHIPVCLGSLHLKRSFPLHSGVGIDDMLLLSWAGESLEALGQSESMENCDSIVAEMGRAEKDLEENGVCREEWTSATQLWDTKSKRALEVGLRHLKTEASPSKKRRR